MYLKLANTFLQHKSFIILLQMFVFWNLIYLRIILSVIC